MSGMARIGAKNVLAHKRRLLGTGLSVIIGISFLAGTFVFTDTIKRTFDTLFADVYANTDVFVRSVESVDMGFGFEVRGRVDEAYVAKVAAVPGVEQAAGSVQGWARIIAKDGDPIGSDNGPPTAGGSVTGGELSPWKVATGRLPTAAGEMVMDMGSFKKGGFVLDDQVTVVSQAGSEQFELVGVVKFGNVDSPGGASFALFEMGQAQEFVGKPGMIDSVEARGDGSVSEEELASRVRAALDGSVETLTGTEITEESQSAIQDALGFFNILLMVFAGIALFVGAFIIYNAFSITVAQRQQQNALMRAIGASRRQVTILLIIEAFVIGVLASLIGFVAGLGMSSALKAFLAGFGVDIPAGGLVVLPRTIVASLVVGITMSVAAALLPALRASKVPPVAAMREIAIDRSAVAKGRIVAGGVIVAAAAVLVFVGLSSEPVLLGLGVPLLFVGVFVLGPVIARPIARTLGRPLQRFAGITGRLARENASRNPKRTARTAAALMVGVALVAGITVLAASIRTSIRSIFDEQFTGDLVVSTQSFGFGGLSPEVADRMNDLPEIEAAAGIGIGVARVNDKDQGVTLVDPATTGQVFDLEYVAGNITDLTVDGMQVSKKRADRDNLTLGSKVPFVMLDGVPRELVVQGIYEKDELAGPVTISKELYRKSGADLYDFSV
ncbi:MAG TPA: ABC transporter permease, partial [Acidimicrobiales bacterium]